MMKDEQSITDSHIVVGHVRTSHTSDPVPLRHAIRSTNPQTTSDHHSDKPHNAIDDLLAVHISITIIIYFPHTISHRDDIRQQATTTTTTFHLSSHERVS